MQTPKTALSNLFALRERERLFHVVWGVARWIALAVTLVVLACIIDWRIDRRQETPQWVRMMMFIIQLIALAVAGWFWLIRPWSKGPALIPLAQRVEKHFPAFDHRLVTSIQLTRDGALTQGMSGELIENVTRETEKISEQHRFSQLADSRRLLWSGGVLLWPILVLGIVILVLGSVLFGVLLKRQLLSDVEIPRKHRLVNQTQRIWPSGEDVTIQYEVVGPVDENKVREAEEKDKDYFGYIRIYPQGHSSTDYPVKFARRIDENRTMFTATIPSSTNFTHRAWIGDGRTKDASEVVFEARPEVAIGEATVAMPNYVPRKPDGSAYTVSYVHGDLKGYEGSRVTVRISSQKPLKWAQLIIYFRDKIGKEIQAERAEMTLGSEIVVEGATRYQATVSFDLRVGMTAYKAEVEDLNGFRNDLVKSARRSIEILPERPPVVALLPERFTLPGITLTEDDVLQGMPIPLGSTIPVEYFFRTPIGAGTKTITNTGAERAPAYLVYRANEGPWRTLPLTEVPQTEQSGEFDPQTAQFSNAEYQKSVLKNQVEFHAKPSSDPLREIPRQYGGGRYDLRTLGKWKKTPDGPDADLEPGDRIEFYVEVYDSKGVKGRTTESRQVEVRTLSEVIDIALKTVKSEEKLRELTILQQGQFSPKKK